jgi:outer membrane lipoprotein-sorting protein
MRISVVYALLMVFTSLHGENPTAKEIMTQMISAIDNLKTARYSLKKQERIGRRIVSSEIIVKLNVSPLKVYVYSVDPNPGAEVLYVRGENKDNVMVKANKFPYITLNLGMHNSLLRSNQHHTMGDVGFNYLGNILKANIAKVPETFYNSLIYEGLIEYKGRSFHKLVIENKNFGYVWYDVKKGETVTSIADKLSVSDFMILQVNPVINDYNDIRPGQKIKVPTAYAKRIVLYVDKVYMLPLVQFIYDDKGLYEYYEMSSFVYNPAFNPAEFTPGYKDYKF